MRTSRVVVTLSAVLLLSAAAAQDADVDATPVASVAPAPIAIPRTDADGNIVPFPVSAGGPGTGGPGAPGSGAGGPGSPGTVGTDGTDSTTGTDGTPGTDGTTEPDGTTGSGTGGAPTRRDGSATGGDDDAVETPDAEERKSGIIAGEGEDDDGGASVGLIVGATLGSLAGIALLGLIAVGGMKFLAPKKGSSVSDVPMGGVGGAGGGPGGAERDVEAGLYDGGAGAAEGVEIAGEAVNDSAGVGVGTAAAIGAGALGVAGLAAAKNRGSDSSGSTQSMGSGAGDVPEAPLMPEPEHDYVIGHGPTETEGELKDIQEKFEADPAAPDHGLGGGTYNRLAPAPAYAGSSLASGARYGGPRGAIIAAPFGDEKKRPTGEVVRETGEGYNPSSVYADMTDGVTGYHDAEGTSGQLTAASGMADDLDAIPVGEADAATPSYSDLRGDERGSDL